MSGWVDSLKSGITGMVQLAGDISKAGSSQDDNERNLEIKDNFRNININVTINHNCKIDNHFHGKDFTGSDSNDSQVTETDKTAQTDNRAQFLNESGE